MLPENDKNIVGKSKPDKIIMASSDWQKAKENADYQSAKKVVAELWSEKKTKELLTVIEDPQIVVFFSQPSTSGMNVIPIVFAEKLSQEFNALYLKGDDYFDALHTQQSKHIPQYRPKSSEYSSRRINSCKGSSPTTTNGGNSST